jgi:DNA anti-recombination protein RmuC
MPEVTRDDIRERLGNIDQIRDILVGPQLREYDTRISQIEAEVSLLRQDIRDRVEATKNSLATDMRTSFDSLEKKLKAISISTSEENTDLRIQLDRTNKKLATTITTLNEAIDKQTNALREDLLIARDKLQEDVRTLRNQIVEELDRQFSALRSGKISRDDMAEILFELGMRLKGNEFLRQLKEATDPDPDIYSSIAILEDINSSENT